MQNQYFSIGEQLPGFISQMSGFISQKCAGFDLAQDENISWY